VGPRKRPYASLCASYFGSGGLGSSDGTPAVHSWAVLCQRAVQEQLSEFARALARGEIPASG
jgi:hypothetical protein